MLDNRTSMIKLGGADPRGLRVLRSGPGRIRAAWSPRSKLRHRPQRNARRTHPRRRQRPPRWNRRPTLGHDAGISTLHLPDPCRISLLAGSDVASWTGRRGRIRPGALGSPNPESLHREPTWMSELSLQPGFPDYPALAIRPRLHQANMPMAAGTSTTLGHAHPLRTRQLDRGKLPQVEAALSPAKSNLPGHRKSHGRAVVAPTSTESYRA